MLRIFALLVALALTAMPSLAASGPGEHEVLMAGWVHPFLGLDHIVVVSALGLSEKSTLLLAMVLALIATPLFAA